MHHLALRPRQKTSLKTLDSQEAQPRRPTRSKEAVIFGVRQSLGPEVTVAEAEEHLVVVEDRLAQGVPIAMASAPMTAARAPQRRSPPRRARTPSTRRTPRITCRATTARSSASTGDKWLATTSTPKSVDMGPLLKWAEQQEEPITSATIHNAQEDDDEMAKVENDPEVLAHHLWGFLNISLVDDAWEVFGSVDVGSGLEVWRLVNLDTTQKTEGELMEMEDLVQNPKRIQK